LSIQQPVMTSDLPAGGNRILQLATGYIATIVSGKITYRNGEPTGALPRRVSESRARCQIKTKSNDYQRKEEYRDVR
jgi:N-acyl-D-aspartate/D-glutamate deacylase